MEGSWLSSEMSDKSGGAETRFVEDRGREGKLSKMPTYFGDSEVACMGTGGESGGEIGPESSALKY